MATMEPIIQSTEITTPTSSTIRQASDQKRARSLTRAVWRGVTPVVSVLLGGLLIYLSIPRTIAAWTSLEAQTAIDKLQNGKLPSDQELVHGASALQSALAWAPSPRRLTDLALLELEQASRLPVASPARNELLVKAELHLIDGLVANPANGFAWLRLAIVRELRGAPARQVALALAQSLDMAPNMRKLWLPRASLFFVYWRDLTFEELLAMRAQLRTIWTADPDSRRALMQAAGQAGQLAVLSWALQDSPPSQADVEKIKSSVPSSLPQEAK